MPIEAWARPAAEGDRTAATPDVLAVMGGLARPDVNKPEYYISDGVKVGASHVVQIHHGGQGYRLVPPYTCGSISLALSTASLWGLATSLPTLQTLVFWIKCYPVTVSSALCTGTLRGGGGGLDGRERGRDGAAHCGAPGRGGVENNYSTTVVF